MDQADLLDDIVRRLVLANVPYCIVGGQAVNAYVEPLVSLDLDLVIAAESLETWLGSLPPHFTIERFPHSINVAAPDSDLRIQLQLDPRYRDFPSRAAERDVLGRRLPVADVRDVLAGKVWAASDAARRPSKRQKDLADIARLLEAYPDLRASVPQVILDRLI